LAVGRMWYNIVEDNVLYVCIFNYYIINEA